MIPGSGRSAGDGNGTPLQYSCLENSMDRGAWQATVHEVAKSRTRPDLVGLVGNEHIHFFSVYMTLPLNYPGDVPGAVKVAPAQENVVWIKASGEALLGTSPHRRLSLKLTAQPRDRKHGEASLPKRHRCEF